MMKYFHKKLNETDSVKEFDDLLLQDCDLEDIEDVFPKIENTFNIKFVRGELAGVNTFGDICHIVEKHLPFNDGDCTSQQAFYKVRSALSKTLNMDQKSLKVDTLLASLVPIKNRIRDWRKIEQQLGIKVSIFTMNKTLVWILTTEVIVSLL